MYEIQYSQVDNNLKIWIDSLSDAEVTIVDGFSDHPYFLDLKKVSVNDQLMDVGDSFEVGDAWYNVTYGGRAFLFIKAKSSGASCTFFYGQKNLLPFWALILIIVASSVVGLVCFFICFCYVRRLYRRKQSKSKVKKYSSNKRVETTEEKLSKYKYNSNK